jgi:hypothetical protein
MVPSQRHAEGTPLWQRFTDQPTGTLGTRAFQAGHAGSIPVTRSTAVSGDRHRCPATLFVRAVHRAAMALVPANENPIGPGAGR